MNWYEQQIIQGYLGGKRRPNGNTVLAPMAGVAYRVPLDDRGHILGREAVGTPDPVFLCGRSAQMDPDWYRASGAHLRWGDWYLIVDTRKTGGCSTCKTMWQQESTDHNWRRSLQRRQQESDLRGSPITKEEYEQNFKPQWEREQKQLELRAQWVAEQFGGEVLENGEE